MQFDPNITAILALSNKNYLIDRQPFMKHFMPQSLAKITAKTVVLQSVVVTAKYMEEMIEAEEDDDDAIPPPELPKLEVFSFRCFVSFGKTMSVITTQRFLELGALHFFDVRTAGKLMKNVSKSAIRKFSRHQSRLAAAQLLLKTGLRSSVLGHIAIFIIEEVQQIYFLIRRSLKSRRAVSEAELIALEDESAFWRHTVKNITRCGVAIICSASGAALGTLVKPGIGTTVGCVIADSLAYM